MSAARPEDLTVLTCRDAAGWLHISVDTLARMRVVGNGPAFIKVGGGVRYRLSDLRAYLDQQTRRSVADDRSRARR